ncbi:DUF6056 family protein [Ruminococcus sp.]|uniref:DUF6056 family protein n=1 Tax=Ruminococcus sp. TaxID=41978 RepID=UPI0025E67388|nr:DUF6056 family protein [Ruminococcus sp.]
MKKHDLLQKKALIFPIIFVVYIIVHCLCLIKTSDDLMWDNIDSVSQMLLHHNPNGRYFTNILTYFICNSPVLCFVVYTFFMGAFLFLIAGLFKAELKHKWVAFLFAGSVLLFSPRYFYVHIYNWISGFTNYLISLVFLLIYIRYCLPLFEKKPVRSKWGSALIFLLIGFVGALCIENITVYNLLFGIFIILFVYFTQKKFYLPNIAYLIGTIAGTIVMMSDSNYKHILEEGDDIAFRSFELSLSDIYMNIYRDVIVNFSRPYFFLHIIITCCIAFIFAKKYGKADKRPKYAAASLFIMIIYTVFVFVVDNGEDIAVLSSAYRSRALEAALTVLYICVLIYMVCSLFEGGKRVRAVIYLLSTIFVTAPFLVVNAITGRCFFASFIFWCLFTCEVSVPVLNSIKVMDTGLVKKCSAVLLVSVLGVNLFVDVTNKVVDIIRINYIHEQLADDRNRQVKLIYLPYQKNCFDPIKLFEENDLYLNKDGKKYSYTELYCINNDIDQKIFDKQLMFIEMLDYSISKEEF